MRVGGGIGGRRAGSKCTARAGIAHIRKLLDSKFAHNQLHEPPGHFIGRMQRVEDHMNSAAFAAIGGQGLMGLAKELRNRCEELKRRQGERLPK